MIDQYGDTRTPRFLAYDIIKMMVRGLAATNSFIGNIKIHSLASMAALSARQATVTGGECGRGGLQGENEVHRQDSAGEEQQG